MSSESKEDKYLVQSKVAWLAYLPPVITIFLALLVLSGRVYTQSYWDVFGLTPESVDTNLIDYAVVSPNTAIASLFIAIATVLWFVFLRKQSPDIIRKSSASVALNVGTLLWLIGVFIFIIILEVDTKTWMLGMTGLIFGIGYFMFVSGMLLALQASLKLQEMRPTKKSKIEKIEDILLGWMKVVPFTVMQTIFILAIIFASFWAFLDTSEHFGANEARYMYETRPIVSLQLDSEDGFEDLPLDVTDNGGVLLKGKIIIETGGFFYITVDETSNPSQLHVRAVPASRIVAIQYTVDVTDP